MFGFTINNLIGRHSDFFFVFLCRDLDEADSVLPERQNREEERSATALTNYADGSLAAMARLTHPPHRLARHPCD